MLTHILVSSIVGASFTFSNEEEFESRKYKKPDDGKILKVVLQKISNGSEVSALIPTEVFPKKVLEQIKKRPKKKLS